MSPRVGGTGNVYATDLQPEMLELLRAAVREAGLGNIEAVRSSDRGTGLPDGAIDLALMVDAYHQLAEPAPFMRDLRNTLAPRGLPACRVVLRIHDKVDQRRPTGDMFTCRRRGYSRTQRRALRRARASPRAQDRAKISRPRAPRSSPARSDLALAPRFALKRHKRALIRDGTASSTWFMLRRHARPGPSRHPHALPSRLVSRRQICRRPGR